MGALFCISTWYLAFSPALGTPRDPAKLGWGGGEEVSGQLQIRCCRGAFGRGALPIPVGTSTASAARRPRRGQRLIKPFSARGRGNWRGSGSLMLTWSTEGFRAARDSETSIADSALPRSCSARDALLTFTPAASLCAFGGCREISALSWCAGGAWYLI